MDPMTRRFFFNVNKGPACTDPFTHLARSLPGDPPAKGCPKCNDCWIWTGMTDRKGYGLHRVRSTLVRAHRFSYKMAKGPIDDGMVLLHSCDIPSCVNPDHLTPGTHGENMADRNEKGRTAKGEKNGKSKLSDEERGRIVALAATTPAKVLASRFNISDRTVRRLVSEAAGGPFGEV